MAIYINGIGLISPQETRNNKVFLEDVIALEQSYFPIAEPPYKEYINPRELRRMSRIIRNGIVAAKIALAETDIENPDAILTGTGLGCATDTDKFLVSMIENKETLLTPTAFIQSTHNTLGGSIAIGLKCHQYNMTYVHRGLSFETALLDAQLMMEAHEIENALVGGFDEMTDNHIKLLQSTPMFALGEAATSGQAAGFFMLEDKKNDNTYAKLLALETLYNPKNTILAVKKQMQKLIESYGLNEENTVIMMGYNGVQREEKVYNQLYNELFPDYILTHFKHLCGEFYTVSAFALWLAAQMIKKQVIPKSLQYYSASIKAKGEIENVLIYNQFQEKEHSLILLGKC